MYFKRFQAVAKNSKKNLFMSKLIFQNKMIIQQWDAELEKVLRYLIKTWMREIFLQGHRLLEMLWMVILSLESVGSDLRDSDLV